MCLWTSTTSRWPLGSRPRPTVTGSSGASSGTPASRRSRRRTSGSGWRSWWRSSISFRDRATRCMASLSASIPPTSRRYRAAASRTPPGFSPDVRAAVANRPAWCPLSYDPWMSASMETIVVGVDGSEGGTAALELAAREADFRGARLRVVSAWEVPVVAPQAGNFGPSPPLDPATIDVVRMRAQQVAEDALAAVKTQYPSVDGEALGVQGHPADVLLAQADEATLIVVGRRGLGGFRSLLLGSVSQQVVQHATCPVVVVNQPATAS